MYETIGESIKGPQDYLDLFRRRKKLLVIPVTVISFVSVVLAATLPPVYESTALILIEEPEVPSDLVQSTVTTYADQRLEIIKHRLTTTQNVGDIIDRYNLYGELRKSQPLTKVAEQFRDDISMQTISARVRDPRSGRPMTATIAFQLSYASSDPRLAQQVTNELVTFYLSENIRERQGQVSETTRFLAQESQRLATQIQGLEAKLAEFKTENAGSLPEQLDSSLSIMDRIERELLDIERRLQSLENQGRFLRAELSTTEPRLAEALDPETALSPEERLNMLRRDYSRLQAIYGPQHPDVLQTRREIEALEGQTSGSYDTEAILAQLGIAQKELAEALERYSPEHPEVRAAKQLIERLTTDLAWARSNPSKTDKAKEGRNPAYVQLQAQLNALALERKNLLAERASLQEKLGGYEARVLAMPDIERVYRGLMRDYENAQLKYRETKDKQLEAELSQSLETDRMSERFSLIEPPQLPTTPTKPKRTAIVGIGLMLALAVGIGLVLVADFFDEGIYGPRQLAVITGEVPLVTIPRIVTLADRIWSFAKALLWIAGTAVTASIALAVVHLHIAPLDDLWFSITTQLGV